MKHLYVVLDYTAGEEDYLSQMGSKLKDEYFVGKGQKTGKGEQSCIYIPIKQSNQKELNKQLSEASIKIKNSLKWIFATKISIIIAGHGQYGQPNGLVSGSSGEEVWINDEIIVKNISTLVGPIKTAFFSSVEWSIKLCICYAGRNGTTYKDKPNSDPESVSQANNSLAGQLTQKIARYNCLKTFKLTAFYTSVAVTEQGFKAVRETDFQQSLTLGRMKKEKEINYPNIEADINITRNKDQVLSDFFILSLDYSDRYFSGEITLMEVCDKVKSELMIDYKENRINRILGEVDNINSMIEYYFICTLISNAGSLLTGSPNKIIWNCINGQVQNPIIKIREK